MLSRVETQALFQFAGNVHASRQYNIYGKNTDAYVEIPYDIKSFSRWDNIYAAGPNDSKQNIVV